MCFLPNSRASTDQAPGPIIAKLAPRMASISGTSGSPTRDKTTHSSTMVTSSPPAGVHKPTRRSIPAPAPIRCGMNNTN
jgi:hypothetical protein